MGVPSKDRVRQCYSRYLRIADKAVGDYYNRIMEPAGVTTMQFSILKNLGELGEGSVSDLALMVELDRTTVVRALKPLYERGFVADRSGKEERNRRLTLTDEGRHVVEIGLPLWIKGQQGVEAWLGTEQVRTLKHLLNTLEKIE